MRTRHDIILALVAGSLLACAVAPARAQNEPVIVVPGRPGVPVMMYGIDVSGAVIEGEFGLNQPGQVAPTVILPYPAPILFVPPPAGYFPATGHRPRTGRLEIIPPGRRGPQGAAPFFRVWGAESAPTPATEPVPYGPIIVTPPDRRSRRPHPPRPDKTP